MPKIAPRDNRLVCFDDIAATIQAVLPGQVDAVGIVADHGDLVQLVTAP